MEREDSWEEAFLAESIQDLSSRLDLYLEKLCEQITIWISDPVLICG
jgi:hypothetical protein